MTIDDIKNRLVHYLLFDSDDNCYFINKDNNYYLGWHKGKNQCISESYFAAQITNGIFYILEIGIDKIYRGRGLGEKLYSILEDIANDFSCSQIQMTASGNTVNGETRINYLCRKLFYKVLKDNVVVKELK